ncbi:hypothetical protein DW086_11850 [Harryflintia acetispora]|nr:hypothetical protein DW086_11850 [Harryflintia acetispora]
MKKKAIAVLLCVLALTVLGGFTVGGSGLREYYEGGSISAEMQLPADAGGPPHGGNHPPVGPLTLRGGATMGESEKIPLDDFTIGEISAASGDVVER